MMPNLAQSGCSQPTQRERYDEGTKCILCGACTGSCPSVWGNAEWVGPASIVNAHRFIFDSRDQGAAERLQILSGRMKESGVAARSSTVPMPARVAFRLQS